MRSCMVPYDLDYNQIKDLKEDQDNLIYLPDSLKGLCIGMSHPDSVFGNLKSFCLPDEKDTELKGMYLSEHVLIQRRIRELR